MSWTDERIETLKRLWSDGHSASQIANELGGVSRNAVIGKVHRLKLESRIKPAATPTTPAAPLAAAEPVNAAPAPQPAPRQAAPAVLEARETPPVAAAPATPRILPSSAPQPVAQQSVTRTLGATALKIEPQFAPYEPSVEEDRPSAEVVPISRNLTLVQLSERTCKWPIGDPLSPDFRFCGNHSGDGSPYCTYHARIAFQPASERRRVR
ncbi:GcrA cell cycle regulator [Aureimonas fodinaquatilis]|uniref:GcrA cell cycle regulator n=1 Tax=Aureimonas fodinaquatilis TaxID=2565783 RepID=A0A5B0E1A3_9HYPH|nr:GcrA family cell cycle regulator [Aureimonas fodinaquatilis]KAA0972426.1 GcrA cell cycle regulator [Aureimonas fodinaquatilis]